MFNTLLIANRGEIACRVAASARRLGIRTVAVYSDADAHARHVAACDTAVHIGGPEPRESYLRGDAILEAARKTGAQAVHPGYGFLSENEAFAQACADAGIIFVGPPNSAIAAMGSKSAAKSLMEKAGVPLVPGYHGDNQDPQFLQSQADAMGYPVLIKASAGGGGKGMRIVENSAAFADALASCKREAASSFGDDKVLIERYLQKPRHIEIQVFADTHGHCVYLFERDCSVQRRHQKVIEEAPAPGMTEERRRAMGDAAVAAARAVNYVGAGTVEFIVEPDGRFYFMEMNTRLQVEHPVTEMITGHDLVEWQLRIAAGEPLPVTQEELHITGHAIEARIYAENPDKGFLPSIGTLATLDFPPHAAFQNGDIRIDGGVQAGDTITPFYDPMIAKLIVRGSDREQARARMVQALGEIRSVGVQTNIAFLRRLMLDPAFAQADLDTGLIERQHNSLFPAVPAASDSTLALGIAALLASRGLHYSVLQRNKVPVDPWARADGWRVAGSYTQMFGLIEQDALREVSVRRIGAQWAYQHQGEPAPFEWDAQLASPGQYRVRIRLGGADAFATVIVRGEALHVFRDGAVHVLQLHDAVAHAQDDGGDHGGGLTAPMPGKIISISVKAGDVVKSGDALLVMEAMKMEHTILAPADGTVQEVFFGVGDQVTDGVELIAISA
ncbi:acetyl/propionyl/methylcrotonyl-CoA carboxylase subunit alpha [Pusillimonas sp. SM2304]|uniref:acetyl/propionyl/methylcrotonyl-CoA carboxylase subunit alpha n=1 Tax=Pusillimonas sp. SM2304 TaxID=3073241 RepID=UPI00287424DE|nr:acetyl/propionyl/methylcrotonyl-CoA carboxylase subunit alpha [Pusillimonas sp. SM2304]MDS1139836.1 acetyl/propionyl/methylcrotonyl-CoA carboxylase subunit alpha [Pusillimonas sp. SM2304]